MVRHPPRCTCLATSCQARGAARIDQRENADSREPALTKDPAENADAIEPADPMERIDPAEPIDRMDPAEPIDKMDPLQPMLRIESAEPIDHDRRLLVRTLALSRVGVIRSTPARRRSTAASRERLPDVGLRIRAVVSSPMRRRQCGLRRGMRAGRRRCVLPCTNPHTAPGWSLRHLR